MTGHYQFEQRIGALPDTMTPVVWFLDIDGVINVVGKRPRTGWAEYKPGAAECNGHLWPLLYAPELVRLLNLLHDKGAVVFRWLTTWEHDGPASFAPAVGLRIGEWVAAEDRGSHASWWKLDAVVQHLVDASHLFIWTDDDIRHFDVAADVLSMVEDGVALAVCPDPRKGLTPENFHAILTAIEEASSW